MIIDLTDRRALDVSIVGGKAYKLAKLLAEGFNVPSGFVITTGAFQSFIEREDLESRIDNLLKKDTEVDPDRLEKISKELQTRIVSTSLPDELKRELEEKIGGYVADALWAVRSSAVAEDLKEASFAGQYDTILGVKGPEEIAGAILKCWASFFNPGVLAYKRDRGISDFRGAVLVMELIDADAAGVCFSANPVDGDDSKAVINSNFGLGESVVGGIVTPDTFVVDKKSRSIVERIISEKTHAVSLVPGGSEKAPISDALKNEPSLSDRQALMVSDLAVAVEKSECSPVDIEWAVKDDRLYLLQSRSITSKAGRVSLPADGWEPELNTPINPTYPLYSNGNISEVLPGCITPLSWSYVGPTIERAFLNQTIETGPTMDIRDGYNVLGFFFHRPYLCVSFLAAAAERTPGMSPDMVMEEFVGPPEKRTPSLTPRDLLPDKWPAIAKLLSVFIKRSRSIGPDTVYQEKFIHSKRHDVLTGELTAWPDRKLVEQAATTGEMTAVSDVHIWASSFAVVYFNILRKLTQKWLGDQDGSLASMMVTGIGGLPSADPAFGLYKLARFVLEDEETKNLFYEIDDDNKLWKTLSTSKISQKFKSDLEKFLEQHGHRAVCEAEFRNPCWRENPPQLIGLIRNYLHEGVTPPEDVRSRQAEIAESAAGRINEMWWPGRKLLSYVLNSARRYMELREKLKDLVVIRSDIARMIYKEIAGRLVSREILNCRDDIFFLLTNEIPPILEGKLSHKEVMAVVARRRREFDMCRMVEVPKIQEGTPRFIGVDEYSSKEAMKGMGVSPGKVEGKARVIVDPRIDSHIEPGEILIAPVTDAGWTPLFINAAGLVVNVGGLLSHGSVVAREYGLPAVVGVAGATKRIKTGDTVMIDGSAGVVIIKDQTG